MARYSAAKIIVRFHIDEPDEVTSGLAALAYAPRPGRRPKNGRADQKKPDWQECIGDMENKDQTLGERSITRPP